MLEIEMGGLNVPRVPQIPPLAGMAPLGAKIDHTAAGQQHVLPGAGRAADAAMTRRATQAPLRARVPQLPRDQRLFSDDRLQTDLIVMASHRHG
jgi:hypothetical protein